MKIKVKAPAKINLTLEIIKRLPNGYHALRSVMIKLPNLCDEITLDFNYDQEGIFIQSNGHAIPLDENNIAHKSALRIYDRVGKTPTLKIKIEKNIPVAAGLAGGSSDAAAVLLAINKHFANALSQRELIKIGSEIGKDVPFFLSSSRVNLISSMGEKITPLYNKNEFNFLIVSPKVHSLTKKAFETLSKELWFMENKKRINVSEKMRRSIEKNNKEEIINSLYNDFEFVLEKTFPIVKEIKQSLLAFGARGALMSGAGSSVFGIFDSKADILKAEKCLKIHYPKYFIKRT